MVFFVFTYLVSYCLFGRWEKANERLTACDVLERNTYWIFIVYMRGERWPVSPSICTKELCGQSIKQLGTANKPHHYPEQHMSNGCCLLGLACINLQPTRAVNWFRLTGSHVRDSGLGDIWWGSPGHLLLNIFGLKPVLLLFCSIWYK